MRKLLIKICGLTRYQDAAAVTEEGADLLGFVLAPSVRQVSLTSVGEIILRLRAQYGAKAPRMVGVLVSPDQNEIEKITSTGYFNILQIHKPEASLVSSLPWYAALPIARQDRLVDEPGYDPALLDFALQGTAGFVLVDAAVRGLAGGSGLRVDGAIAREVLERVRARGQGMILAGGLNPKNIILALDQVFPDGIDLASGLEASPGIKSVQKIKDFFTRVREWKFAEPAETQIGAEQGGEVE